MPDPIHELVKGDAKAAVDIVTDTRINNADFFILFTFSILNFNFRA
jgi:hypothetical protein